MTDDLIRRAAAYDAIDNIASELHKRKRLDEEYIASWCADVIEALPSAQPVSTYQTCSNALLKMWMDNVLIDGEYNRIMDKLNAWKGNADADHD